jgi:hypothetical protein
MPTWLVDDPTMVFLILGLAALGLGAGWWTTRKRAYALGFGVAVGLIVLVWLLSAFVPTDAKQIERAIRDMGDGVEAKNVEQIFQHISDHFEARGRDKAAFRNYAERFLRTRDAQGVRVWDFTVLDLSRLERRARVQFSVKAAGIEENQGLPFYKCRAAFALEPEGQWRMTQFELFPPTANPDRTDPLPLP